MKFNWFQRWALATLLATLFLVFVGGFVRVAGAGLGCPDWPRCWGLWLPPTSVEQIDAARYDVAQFNPLKMWIEYANRLVGVAVGLLVLGTFALSFTERRRRPALIGWSFLAVVLVVFQGWLGGRVVRSGLEGGMITIHLAAALLLLALLLWIVFRAAPDLGAAAVRIDGASRRRLLAATVLLVGLTVIQVLLGAQVREAIDAADPTAGELSATGWTDDLGWAFPVHRSFAWTLVASTVVLVWLRRRERLGGVVGRAVDGVGILMAIQAGSGILLERFGLPPAFQVVHLGGSAVVFCLALFVLMALAGGGRSPAAGTVPDGAWRSNPVAS